MKLSTVTIMSVVIILVSTIAGSTAIPDPIAIVCQASSASGIISLMDGTQALDQAIS